VEPEKYMKQIIAIIRDEQVEMTKVALESIGVGGVTFLYVTGRGQQRGMVNERELGGGVTRHMRMQLSSAPSNDKKISSLPPDDYLTFGFLPKRMLIIIAYDKDVNRILHAIVETNQTGKHGDGRIFICPMISAIRIRTGDQGDKALS
jgi:nitrogen regulatory protein PII 2